MTDHLRDKAAAKLMTSFELLNESVFAGFVLDLVQPARRFTVELLIDGLVVKTAHADNYVQELASQKVGDGCYGFAISLDRPLIENAALAEVRVANLGLAVGSPLILNELRRRPATVAATSSLTWRGGLRFSGWTTEITEIAPVLEVTVGGETVMEVVASGWAQADDAINADRPARAFDFHLPERFADGCVRWVSARKPGGEALGEPLPFVAFRDGLAATLGELAVLESERLKGEIYDRLIPMSLPLSSYEQWHARLPPSLPTGSASNCAVVMVGSGSIETTLESLEIQTHTRWTAVSVDQEGDPTAFDASLVQSFLNEDAQDSDIIVFVLSGTSLAPEALDRFVGAFSDHVDGVAGYADLSIIGTDGSLWPIGLPDFDYERMLEQGYCAYLFGLRRSAALELLNAQPANLYRLFNSLFDDDQTDPASIIHIPGPLGTLPAFDVSQAARALQEATSSHLQRREMLAAVTAMPSVAANNLFPVVRVQRSAPDGRTTIIIPTRNRLELLRDCLQSIEPAVDQIGADILIVDNDTTEPETRDFLLEATRRPRIKVLRAEGPFNYSRLNNLAVQACETEFLCLLNNDIKALDADWLSEMLSRCGPDVGAVGALLLWPSGLVQHGGVVLGPSFSATHAFNDRMAGDPGYAGMLQAAHQCSAVTAACLVTRRRDYLAVGGLDEIQFPVSFNDVDYCLKLREASKRIVFTPYAKLIHLESASRGKDREHGHAARFSREIQALRSRWGQLIIDDPYYNPMLSLDQIPYSGLAWPPRNMAARCLRPVKRRETPNGF